MNEGPNTNKSVSEGKKGGERKKKEEEGDECERERRKTRTYTTNEDNQERDPTQSVHWQSN
jgi:hypothetical protein